MALHMLSHPKATQKNTQIKSARNKEDNKVLLNVMAPLKKVLLAAIFNCFQFN